MYTGVHPLTPAYTYLHLFTPAYTQMFQAHRSRSSPVADLQFRTSSQETIGCLPDVLTYIKELKRSTLEMLMPCESSHGYAKGVEPAIQVEQSECTPKLSYTWRCHERRSWISTNFTIWQSHRISKIEKVGHTRRAFVRHKR